MPTLLRLNTALLASNKLSVAVMIAISATGKMASTGWPLPNLAGTS